MASLLGMSYMDYHQRLLFDLY